MANHCTPESRETPRMESRSHSSAFLRKATRLAEKSEIRYPKLRMGKRAAARSRTGRNRRRSVSSKRRSHRSTGDRA